jgi:SAM-dependent methyltransferase
VFNENFFKKKFLTVGKIKKINKKMRRWIVLVFLFMFLMSNNLVFASWVVKERVEQEKPDSQEGYQLGTSRANYDPKFISHCEKIYYGRPEVPFVLGLLQIKKGMTVGDIGCGVGSYTFPIAVAAGKRGKVYAVDIQERMVKIVRKHMQDKRQNPYNNIIAYVNKFNATLIPKNSLDVAWVSMLHFHNFPVLYKENVDMIMSIYDSLKPAGRLVIADEPDEPGYILKPWPNIIKHYRQAGFIFVKGPIQDLVGKTSFYLIFKKPQANGK